MNKQQKIWYWALLALGVVLVAVCGFALKGVLPKAVGGVCLGGGCALAAVAGTMLLTERMLAKNPEMRRKMRVDEGDERNVTIRNRAKAKAFDAVSPVFFIVALATILLGAELLVTLLIVGGYTVVYAVYFVYLSRYNKEM